MHKWPMLSMFPHHIMWHPSVALRDRNVQDHVVWEHRQHWPFVHPGCLDGIHNTLCHLCQTVDNHNSVQPCYILAVCLCACICDTYMLQGGKELITNMSECAV